ncbi:MAG: transcriptional regulator [Pseudomonadota bacterium]|nr:transcriptional regulator [Pseudomonadota bacterium]
MKHSELKEKALKNKTVQVIYDALEPEFSLLRDLLNARQKTGISQAEIAERMGTKAPAITRSLSENVFFPHICVMLRKLSSEYLMYACGNFLRMP